MDYSDILRGGQYDRAAYDEIFGDDTVEERRQRGAWALKAAFGEALPDDSTLPLTDLFARLISDIFTVAFGPSLVIDVEANMLYQNDPGRQHAQAVLTEAMNRYLQDGDETVERFAQTRQAAAVSAATS